MTVKRVGVVFPKAAKKGDAAGAKTEEAALGKVVTELQAVQKAIAEEIATLMKSDPLPDSIKKILDKLKTINESSRLPELKDLAKAAKAGSLRSNPSKIERVMDDLNDDVNRVNGVPAALEKALDAHFEAEMDKVKADILKDLPKGVQPANFALDALCTAFAAKMSKAKWSGFDAAAKKFKEAVAKRGEEEERKNKMREISESFRESLRYSERQKIHEDALKDAACTPTKLKEKLQEALDDQETPKKARWAKYLSLGAGGSYKLTDGGTYQGTKIHVTMSKDSWTADADKGVSLMDGSAAQVLKNLLDTTDWQQMHATLETAEADYPHVFLYAGVLKNDKRWEAARVALGKDKKWVEGAQAAMTTLLDGVKARLEKLITEARKDHGAKVY